MLEKEKKNYIIQSGGRELTSLIEIEKENMKLLKEKQELENSLNNSGQMTLKKLSDEQISHNELILELDEVDEELQSSRKILNEWKQKLKLEKIKMHPLIETKTDLEQKIEMFKKSKELLKATFKRYDIEKNGLISFDNMIDVLNELVSFDKKNISEKISLFLKEKGKNVNDKVNINELSEVFIFICNNKS